MSKWNLVSLKEIVNNLDNKRVPLNSSQRELKESKSLYPYIGANNIMGYIDEYIFDEKILCVAEDGGSWGYNQKCAVLYNEKVWVNNHAHVITAKENLVLEYLMYYLNHTDLNLYINGATRGKLTKSSLESIQVPLPPLPQQQKIANILDAADALRQNDKALIAKYDELTQALFLDMFGDPVSNPKGWKLKEGSKYYEVRGRVGWKGYKKTDLRQSGAIVLGATHINNLGTIDLSKVVFLSQEKYIESPEIMVQKYDLIFVQRGNTIGKIALVRDELGEATINPVVLIFRPINANPFFLLYLLMNKGLNREFVGSNSGSAQPMITQKTMKDFLMIDVPLSLQNQFAERVAVIEEQKAIAQKSLEHSESLFNSLLQKAFKGELV
jgi:type I restriction enzyme S subunit